LKHLCIQTKHDQKWTAGPFNPTDEIISTAKYFEQQGIARFDALHVACALAAQVDIFITTDDRLLKKCQKFALQLNTQRPHDALAILGNWYED